MRGFFRWPRTLILGIVVWAVTAIFVAQPWAYTNATAAIVSATTTTVLAGVSGQNIEIWSYSVCVDASGVATTVTLQDSGGTNLIGTSITYPLNPGQCLTGLRSDPRHGPQLLVGKGLGLAVVTSAAGPVKAVFEVNQR